MKGKILNDLEKRKLIAEVLKIDPNLLGKNYKIFSVFIDNISRSSDALTVAELLPYLNSILSRPMASAIMSNLSFVGVLLFPLGQLINVVNAYQSGHRMYAYRSIAYAITAWAYDKPILTGSQRILLNAKTGDIKKTAQIITEYNKVWRETSSSVIRKLDLMALEAKVPKDKFKLIFRIFGDNKMDKLCRDILVSFENEFNTTYKNVWKSTYTVCYPQ